ncbi:FAD-binding oxidoreductase [Agromyces atrinae]|uniref:Ferredoxin-NADP reductase n=1 Tax=Agromyces atrinae TaxID=592376 RepID=A0A4Q2M751_9MICO|nr:FAD-binding oxidoreductase [Agromyces atrinae]NYD67758.1 ferredoxin-NADP reductase [Agromyces atrinae]RXZ88054.1 oxidoreductase [Agromyces atrinae]
MIGRRPAAWHTATVVESTPEAQNARLIVFDIPTWPGNDAGSHLDVRLTAPDGYQATRSYSIASAGEGTRVSIAVAEVPTGEVSPFLVHELRAGDEVEVHGPLGAFFVWRPSETPRPVQLIGGGSGVVPLVAMATAHAASSDASPFRLLYSVRTPEDAFFARELEALADDGASPSLEIDWAYTRQAPPGWPTPPGRLTREQLEALVVPAADDPLVFICGPTPFVEAVASWLTDLGHSPGSIRTERFGGS